MGGAIMYWLMLLVGIAAPIMVSAQSRFQEPEPDYAQGYEQPYSERTEWPRMDPGQRLSPATEAGTRPEYRFRGDPPPSAGGTQVTEPDSELRFRPLTPRERERQGPTTRWRPTDEERRGDPPERSTLFDTLAPGAPPPGPWWPR
ncbi:hypothetical protein [Allochromatium tepidum]|uniref:Uncharacterized protein n=1 Tax=Allochromatium tepidum TaxID=553982 RepID=A0ABN6GCE7_9GAMM|nr:hypothetical protein [Allochromatium tepidum]BCU07616.1 hypothetical protein Atep_22930 [Allochromatium tepidum]